MSNITKDDIFKIHESLVDSFANNEQAKERSARLFHNCSNRAD